LGNKNNQRRQRTDMRQQNYNVGDTKKINTYNFFGTYLLYLYRTILHIFSSMQC
jgi:hypothetical protein